MEPLGSPSYVSVDTYKVQNIMVEECHQELNQFPGGISVLNKVTPMALTD